MMELAESWVERISFYLNFVAVVGEEQGLYGAKHLADVAKDGKWNVIAMLNNDMIGNSYLAGQCYVTILKYAF
jgi:Zn-dependent M28 family amino/carboxypeptidase